MDNIFLYAGVIAGIFFIAKFIEMRYIEQESKPLKILIRDALLVYISVVVGNFVMEEVNPALQTTLATVSTPEVFNDAPDF